MKILIVCSANHPAFDVTIHQAFIYDQVKALEKIDNSIKIDFFFIKGKGFMGYLKNLKNLNKILRTTKYNLVHAHFSLSGLLANLQRQVPVVTTFHGTDINNLRLRIISFFVELLSRKTIYVSPKLLKLAYFHSKKKSQIVPCGVDFELFQPLDISLARSRRKLPIDRSIILFSSSFENPVKNFPLLQQAINLLNHKELDIIELKNLHRQEVMEYMNSANVCVMTSLTEGSPQFIKEAMACNRPIVTTEVGDVKEVIGETDGCFYSTFDPKDLANKIDLALNRPRETDGRSRIKKFNNCIIAKQILGIYSEVYSSEKSGKND